MKANVALRASACVLNRQRARSSHSSVAKKLSHMALSYASPTEPIEGRTPASRASTAEGQRRVLASLIAVVDDIGRLALPQRHAERVQHQLCAEMVAIDQPTMRRLNASSTTAR